MSRGGAEREGDRESEAGSRLWAVSTEPDAGLKPTDHEIMTWAEVGCLTDWATNMFQKQYIIKRNLLKNGFISFIISKDPFWIFI